jgi:UDP-N-acetylglucosamine--N-acetylmuramyl-(pentapeptide) pyrophosphoryl-undecaprenol N-acetylglucosamine transferase
MNNFDASIPVHTIFAGKLRRYHHLSVLRQLLWPSLVLSNIKDAFLVVFGFIQSFIKLIIWRPDVVFTKGGYVCLPVGFAVKLLGIPLVIHDSDAHPGLTNRILGQWATKIATGAPLEYYSYPADRSKYVGIPISPEFHEFTDKERANAREQWGISDKYPLVVVTGGGLGASRINDAVVLSLKELLKVCSVVLVSGAGQYDELRATTPPNNNRFQLHSFVSKDMALLLGAADVVITRAGATTILELAALVKPTILVPNGKLTGGHQLKNAAVYLDKGAVVVTNEDEMENDPSIIVSSVKTVLADPKGSRAMAKTFSSFARPDAAKDVAKMIISAVK